MSNRTHTGVLLGVLAAWLAGCDGVAPVPTAPSTVPQSVPQTSIQLAGTVSDAAWRPLAGARVEVVDGPLAGLSTTADTRGEFRLAGRFDDTTHFRATKDGHVAATWPLPAICDRCNPQRWIHFYLETLAPHANLAGDYTLTFVADSACGGLPDEARKRTYGATVTLSSRSGEPANSRFDVTVTGGTLLEHYNSFTIGIAGDYLMSEIGDGHGSPGLVERVAPNTYLTLDGTFATSVTDTSTISGPFHGAVDHCALAAEWGSGYSCPAAVAGAHCFSQNHQLILRRQ